MLNELDLQQRRKLAIWCQSLYLANLLILPGISFLVLMWMFMRFQNNSLWLRHHLRQAFLTTVAAGVMLIMPLLVIYFSEQFAAYFMVYLFYFVVIHASLVLLGLYNLNRAMVNKRPFSLI